MESHNSAYDDLNKTARLIMEICADGVDDVERDTHTINERWKKLKNKLQETSCRNLELQNQLHEFRDSLSTVDGKIAEVCSHLNVFFFPGFRLIIPPSNCAYYGTIFYKKRSRWKHAFPMTVKCIQQIMFHFDKQVGVTVRPTILMNKSGHFWASLNSPNTARK